MATKKAAAGTSRPQTRAEAEAWRALHRQLAAAKTYREIEKLAKHEPPPNARRYYANLRAFLRGVATPRGATRSERFVFRKLRLRFGGNVER
jgi:hypothetical protein